MTYDQLKQGILVDNNDCVERLVNFGCSHLHLTAATLKCTGPYRAVSCRAIGRWAGPDGSNYRLQTPNSRLLVKCGNA